MVKFTNLERDFTALYLILHNSTKCKKVYIPNDQGYHINIPIAYDINAKCRKYEHHSYFNKKLTILEEKLVLFY